MAELLRIGASVATPLGLFGLVAVLAYFAYRGYLKHQETQLEKLPTDQRARTVDELATRYGVDGSKLTKEQQHDLIRRDQDHKLSRSRWGLIASVFVASLIAILAVSFYRPELPPQTITANIAFQGQDVRKKFTLTFLDEAGKKYEVSGTDGATKFELPGSVRLLKNASIDMSCYKRKDAGAIEIVEGKPVTIDLDRLPTKMPDQPFVPGKLPDLLTLVPLKDRPTPDQLKTTPIIGDPGQAVLEPENNTEGFIRLLLHSFDDKRANPSRVVMSDHCEQKPFNKFTERTGWFAFFAQTEAGGIHYLGCADVYAKARTKLVLEKRDNIIVGDFK